MKADDALVLRAPEHGHGFFDALDQPVLVQSQRSDHGLAQGGDRASQLQTEFLFHLLVEPRKRQVQRLARRCVGLCLFGEHFLRFGQSGGIAFGEGGRTDVLAVRLGLHCRSLVLRRRAVAGR